MTQVLNEKQKKGVVCNYQTAEIWTVHLKPGIEFHHQLNEQIEVDNFKNLCFKIL